MAKLVEVWIKLRGEIPSSAEKENSASLAQDDHPTRYFVALWERTHWIVESSVMTGLHSSQQACHSYEEIAEMYAEWFKYKLNRKRRSDALRGHMTSVSDDLFSAVMKMVDGMPAPGVAVELYFEPSVPVYPLVNLSWIPGGADWRPAAPEVDAVEPWPGDSAATVHHARGAPDGPGDSPSDSHFGPDSPDPNGPTNQGPDDSTERASQARGSASRSPRDIDSAIDLLADAAFTVTQAATPSASGSPGTL
ncbi:unnamed protein product [Phytophthora fragariaefolia]|uniref:Unnamed protein product n=1 Tax=Phytophthora fragariaefolia TaxID=1490495 RepID=A0A9W6XYY5_9STRA|nr:unnamed protein product [Phytophthora fragariaefolia]